MAALAVMRNLQADKVIPDTAEGKKSRIDPSNFTLFIHRIAKEIRPNLNVSKEMIATVNDLLLEVLVKVVKAGDAIAAYGDVITLNVREIEAAVKSTLPNALLPHVLKAAVEACNNYDSKLLNPPKRQSRSKVPPSTDLGVATSQDSPVDASQKKIGGTRSERAALTIPISRVETLIRGVQKTQTTRVGEGAPVYLAAVLDFLARRLLSDAGEITLTTKIHIIKAEHLVAAMEKDYGLRELFAAWLLIRPTPVGEETPVEVTSNPQTPASVPVPVGN